jgi:peptidoglycan/LPS O-acetylase OafA/YrhL
MATAWLRALGRWSYAIYLFHMLPLLGLMAWFRQGERSGYAIVATYVVMLLASIALGL